MNHTAIRWKNLGAMIWSIWRMGIKQLENTKTKKEPNRTEFHHFMNLAGTQIDVSICFTEYSQLSSLAAELWTSCCPLLVCDNILNSWIIMKTWNKCSLEQSVTHTHTHKNKKKSDKSSAKASSTAIWAIFYLKELNARPQQQQVNVFEQVIKRRQDGQVDTELTSWNRSSRPATGRRK